MESAPLLRSKATKGLLRSKAAKGIALKVAVVVALGAGLCLLSASTAKDPEGKKAVELSAKPCKSEAYLYTTYCSELPKQHYIYGMPKDQWGKYTWIDAEGKVDATKYKWPDPSKSDAENVDACIESHWCDNVLDLKNPDGTKIRVSVKQGLEACCNDN